MTTSPCGPAALWTTARVTGKITVIISSCLDQVYSVFIKCIKDNVRVTCCVYSCQSLPLNVILSLVLHRNYVSYLIPMSIFNMGIQVFVVLSSYQYIDKKFKKTGQAKVKYPVHFTILEKRGGPCRDPSIHYQLCCIILLFMVTA